LIPSLNKRLVIGVLIVVGLCVPLAIRWTYAAEPTLVDVLTTLGFTNVSETSVETFPAGYYEVTLYAEFAGYHATNELSYYPINTSSYNLLFSGPEGNEGYISPPLNKTFSCSVTFGLSMYVGAEGHRYFTENTQNPDGENHSKVFLNLDAPDMYLIGFENVYGAGDRDYNDMIFSLQLVKHYLDVNTNPPGITTIPGESWYNHGDNVSLTAPSTISVSSNTRYRFNHWELDTVSQGTGVNPIIVYMDTNHTATATFTLQYYLTMSTNMGTVSPSSGWHDEGSNVNISAFPPSAGAGERYVWNGWTGTGTGSYTGLDNPAAITMNGPVNETASWTHQYNLTVISPYDTPGGGGWYNDGSIAYATLATGIIDHGNGTRRVFTSWSGDASGTNIVQSDPILMNGPKTAVANWKTQYYLTLTTDPSAITTPSLEGWYDTGTFASISTDAVIDIVPGSSRYSFSSWTTADMPEITDPYSSSTTVLMDKPKTVTANYVTQYLITFDQSGVSLDYTSTVVTVDGSDYGVSDLPISLWWDDGSSHSFSFKSPLVISPETKRYVWESTSGLSALQADSLTATMSGSITGNYKIQYYLKITTSSGGSTNPPSSGWWDDDTPVSVTAIPGINYLFDHWELDTNNVGSSNPYTVTMNSAHTLHGVFEPIITGGLSVSIKSPHLTWMIINIIAIAAIFSAALWTKKIQRK